MNRSRILSALAFTVAFSPCLAQEAAPAPQLETGVLLSTADLLPAELIKGPSHRVREQVPTDGCMAHFTIDTDFGVFTAIGVPQVKKRIVEAEAAGKLVATSITWTEGVAGFAARNDLGTSPKVLLHTGSLSAAAATGIAAAGWKTKSVSYPTR